MKNLKISLLMIIIMILTISAANAVNIEETSDSSILTVDETAINEVVASDTVNDVTTSSNEAEVLVDSGDVGNFTSLQTIIDEQENSLTLNKDYTRVADDCDIEINKDFTIDGANTYKIDANNLGRIFKVNSGCKLTLIGLTLVNGNAENGGAIYNDGILNIENCKLLDNTAAYSGGAIYNNQGIVTVKDSTLDGNDLTSRHINGDGGAAIYDNAGTVTINHSNITNNLKNIIPRAGYDENDDLCSAAVTSSGTLTVTDSYFSKNSGSYGGAILSMGSNAILNIKGTTFEDNYAFNGGAINFVGNYYTITNCTFKDNQARGSGSARTNVAHGGAICSQEKNINSKIANCNFINNSASYGGAISAVNANVSGCNFTDNTALPTYSGTFKGKTNNVGGMGASLYVGNGKTGNANNVECNLNIHNCNFTDNSGNNGYYGLYAINVNTQIKDSSFINTMIENSAAGSSIALVNNTYDNTELGTNEEYDVRAGSAKVSIEGDMPKMKSGQIQVGNLSFTELKYIIDNTEGKIYLNGNITKLASEEESFANGIVINREVYIYFQGNSIISNNGKVFYVEEDSSLSLKGANVIGEGSAAIINYGKVTLDKSYSNTFANVGDYAIDNQGTVYQTGMTNFTQLNNLIALVNGGTVDIGSSKITKSDEEKEAFKDGIIIDKDVYIKGFVNNKGLISNFIDADNDGKIFKVENDTILSLNDIILTKGSAENGGAVYVGAGATLDANNVEFSNNVALENGGAIYTDAGTITLTDCVLDSNDVVNLETDVTQNKGGAAIYAKNAQVTLVGSDVTNNGRRNLDRSQGDMINAVINALYSNVSITGGLFENNTAIYGGAIYAEGDGTQTLSVSGATFNSNKAYNGGAIDIENMKTTISDSTFSNNFVVGPGSSGYYSQGGAIATSGSGSFDVSDSTFKSNSAIGVNATAGAIGIGLDENCVASIDNCTFEKNTAVLKAGAVFANADNVSISNSTFTDDNNAEIGNSIYNGGILGLNHNTVLDPQGITSKGTISSSAYVIFMDNETQTYTALDSVKVHAKLVDDNNNIIKTDSIKLITTGFSSGSGATTFTYNETDGLYYATVSASKTGIGAKVSNPLKNAFSHVTVVSQIMTVNKLDPVFNITAIPSTVDYSGDITFLFNLTGKNGVKLSSSNSYPITLTVGENDYRVKVTSGSGNYVVENLTAGKYVVTAFWTGNNVYNNATVTCNVTVNKVNITKFTVEVADIIDDETATVIVKLTGLNDVGLNDTVKLLINDKEYTVKVTDGIGTQTIEGMEHGSYSVLAEFTNENYNTAYNSTIFYVKSSTIVSIDQVEDIVYGDEVVLTVRLTDKDENGLNGVVVLGYGETTIEVLVTNGVGTYTIDKNAQIVLTKGEQTFNAVYEGTNDYNASESAEMTFTVDVKEIAEEDVDVEFYGVAPDEVLVYIWAPDGRYNVTVDDQTVQVVVDDGYGSASIYGLSIGNKTATISIDDDNCNLTPFTKEFKYFKSANFYSQISKESIQYGENATLTIEIDPDATGNVLIYINDDFWYEFIVDELRQGVETPLLDVGYQEFYLRYLGDENFNEDGDFAEIEIKKATPSINVNVTENPKVGENVTVNVTVDINDESNVTVTVDGKEIYNGSTDHGFVSADVNFDLTAGKHAIIVNYIGNNNYNPNQIIKTFNVVKNDPTISIVVDDKDSLEAIAITKLTVTVDGADGYILIEGLDAIIYEKLNEGSYVLDNLELIAGDYNITVTYFGNEKFNNATDNLEFTVNQGTATSKITDLTSTIKGGENATFTVNVISNSPNAASGTITVYVDGEFNQTIDLDENNAAQVIIPSLTNGTHTIAVKYDGNNNYKPSDNVTTTITVEKAASKVTIEEPIADADVGSEVVIRYSIENETGKLTISVTDENGIGYDGYSVENGVITVTGLSAGKYTVFIQNDENNFFTESDATATFNVNQLPSTILINPISDVYYNGAAVEITYTINPDTDATVSITDEDGNTYSDYESEDGKITIQGLPAGKYIISIRTPGDANHSELEANATFNVLQVEPDIQANININDVKAFAEGVGINITIDKDVTGIISVKVDGQIISIGGKATNGEMFINILSDMLTAGTHVFEVDFSGDVNHTSNQVYGSFNVVKANPSVVIDVDEELSQVNITVSGKATGYIKVDYEGDVSVEKLTDGKYSFGLYYLEAGLYEINVNYLGDENYNEAVGYKNFTVAKSAATVDINITTPSISVEDDAVIIITMSDDYATGNVTIFINGIENQTVELDEDYANATVILTGLGNGTYAVSARYNGNDNYNASDIVVADENIKVAKVKPGLEIISDVEHVVYGHDFAFTILANYDKVKGIVSIFLNGTFYANVTMDSSIGFAKINASDLHSGNNTIAIQYMGNDNYNASDIVGYNVTVIADEELVNFTMAENSTDAVFSLKLPNNATGYLLVDVDGKRYYAPVENGTATVTVPGLSPGNYTVSATYTGDENYSSASGTKNISVPSNVNETSLTIPESSETTSPTYSVNLPSDATGYLEVDVDGKKYVAALNNGSASVTIPELSEGNHNVTVTYTGDGKYSSISKNTTLNVHVPVYKITNNKNVAAIYSAKSAYKVLITKDGKAVGAGETVTFNFNGKTYTVKTDSKGYATLNLNTKVKVKKYNVTAEYNGVKVSNKVTIKHIIKAKNKTYGKKTVNRGKSKYMKIKISLKKVNGKYLKGKKLKIKFKGKKYTAKTNKKGVATWKVKKSILKKLKTGKNYKYSVTYGKDKVTKKIKVKK